MPIVRRLRRLLESGRRALCACHERGWWFALPALAVFVVAQAIVRTHHELWRDEISCWAVGRSASGLWDLLTGDRRYDGHPFLWYYLLHLVSRLTPNPVALHFVSAALAAVAGALWLRFAPVPRLLRLMLLGSYYVFYEYGVICRSYALGWVLICAFCALYHPLRIRYVWSGLILGLLSATSLYGTIIALALGWFLFSHGLQVARVPVAAGRFNLTVRRAWLIGVAMFAAGLLLTAATTIPPSDALYAPGQKPIGWKVVVDALGWYWKALFPFRGLETWDWPHMYYVGDGWRQGTAAPWLGAGWLAAWMWAFRRRPRVALTYALGVVMNGLAQYAIYNGGWRHIGHHFLLLAACVWLYARDTRGRAPARLVYTLFAISLAVQGVTAFTAVRTDWTTAFSGAEETARFIRDNHLETLPVVAHTDATAATVATLLRKPFFYPVTGETSETSLFHNRRGSPSEDDVLQHAVRLARAAHGEALLILNYDNGAQLIPGVTVRLLHRCPPSMVLDESFRVYMVDAAP